MKHAELPPETVCLIYGHQQMRWLPFVGPPPLPLEEGDWPSVLVCLFCNKIVECST